MALLGGTIPIRSLTSLSIGRIHSPQCQPWFIEPGDQASLAVEVVSLFGAEVSPENGMGAMAK